MLLSKTPPTKDATFKITDQSYMDIEIQKSIPSSGL
jgi:hypothetical protein